MNVIAWSLLNVSAATMITAAAHASEWTAWQPVPDGRQNRIEIRYNQGASTSRGGENEIWFQLRNRYPGKAMGRIEIIEEQDNGRKKSTDAFTLAPGEQEKKRGHRVIGKKIVGASVTDLQLGDDARAAESTFAFEIRRLREQIQRKRGEFDQYESERRQADLLAAHARSVEDLPQYRALSQSQQMLAGSVTRDRADRARAVGREIVRLEKELEAAKRQQSQAERSLMAARRFESEKKWAEAEHCYRELLQQDPNNADYRRRLNQTLELEGKRQE